MNKYSNTKSWFSAKIEGKCLDNPEVLEHYKNILEALQLSSKKRKPQAKKVVVKCPDDVPEQLWNDFKLQRKKQKADITETALNLIISQARQANWTLEEALQEICARGWRGFKNEWVDAKPRPIEDVADDLPEWLKPLAKYIDSNKLKTFMGDAEFNNEAITVRSKFTRDYVNQHFGQHIRSVFGDVEIIY